MQTVCPSRLLSEYQSDEQGRGVAAAPLSGVYYRAKLITEAEKRHNVQMQRLRRQAMFIGDGGA
jgi:hypothetical protein